MPEPHDGRLVSPAIGQDEQFFADIAAGRSRLVLVVDPDAGELSVFGLQYVNEGHGAFIVRRRDGRHIGTYADMDAAFDDGVRSTAMRAA